MLYKLDTETYGNYGLKRPSGPGVVPSLRSGHYSPGPSGSLKAIVP